MTESGFEEVRHTADWALRAEGATLEELLLNASRGMLSLLGAEPAAARATRSTLELEAEDPESLLVAWLGELLYRMETRQVTFGEMKITIPNGFRLVAEVQEIPLLHQARSIKAVTYHDLAVKRTPDGLTATIVFDV